MTSSARRLTHPRPESRRHMWLYDSGLGCVFLRTQCYNKTILTRRERFWTNKVCMLIAILLSIPGWYRGHRGRYCFIESNTHLNKKTSVSLERGQDKK